MDANRNITHRIVPEFEEDLLGLPYPVLLIDSVIEEFDPETGEALTHTIPALDSLVAAVAIVRALTPVKLAPEEVRFVRKAMDMTGRDLAEALNTTPETVSRWENGGQAPGEFVERLLRHLVCGRLRDLAPAIDVDPNAITTMRVLAEWPPGSEYRIALTRVILKDACTRHKQDTWDRSESLAA